MGTITIHSRKLFTLYPDGTEYKELAYPTQWTKNRIGEYKKVTFSFSSTQDLANSIIYFNPALCIVGSPTPYTTGSVPLEGFSYIVDAASTMGTYSMVPFALVGTSADAIRNYSCEIEIGYGDDFKIHCKYFQTADKGGFMSGVFQDNQNKLLKDSVINPLQLTIAGNTVYNNIANIPRFYVCQVSLVGTKDVSFITSSFDTYKAGFYNKNEHETTPYFSNPVWGVKTTDGTLSKLVDTQIEFNIDAPVIPFNWFVWMIRVDKNDNTVDFYTNYEASFHKIGDDAGTGTLNNKLKAPSLFFALDSGSTYKGSFYVDKSLLTDGATYRFISVCYATETNDVNSFISEEVFTAPPAFDGQGYTFVAKLRDYFNDYYGNKLTCTIEERIQSIINLNYTYFGFSTDMEQRLGLVVPNDIRRYATKIMVEIYDQPSAQLRQYYDRVIAYKTGPTTYTVPSNMELNFTTDNLEIKYLFRNRYEADVPNVESLFNELPIPATTTQDWGGKTLKIKTTVELYYDDYATPFTDALEFIQEITVRDYATVQQANIYKTGTSVAPRISEYYCLSEVICLDAWVASAAYAGFRLLTTIEKETGNIATIEENEELTGLFTQLDSAKFYDQEHSYGQTVANRAKFCLDGTLMTLDKQYKLCAISKKLTL